VEFSGVSVYGGWTPWSITPSTQLDGSALPERPRTARQRFQVARPTWPHSAPPLAL
jgi:hypothetical protein